MSFQQAEVGILTVGNISRNTTFVDFTSTNTYTASTLSSYIVCQNVAAQGSVTVTLPAVATSQGTTFVIAMEPPNPIPIGTIAVNIQCADSSQVYGTSTIGITWEPFPPPGVYTNLPKGVTMVCGQTAWIGI